MADELHFDGSIFGYSMLKNKKYTALCGETVKELRIGMSVILEGDSRGYVPSDFSPNDTVTILDFCEPFKNGESDHIIKVGNQTNEGWVKPSNIRK